LPKPIDLSKLTSEQLKNLLTNAERKGEATITSAVVQEMAQRGIASRREYRTLQWNQERIRELMEPFREVASTVRGNERTAHNPAGGRKRGSRIDDPNHMWIDTYSAIKTARVNAVFGCYIRKPGDEPEFRLSIDKKTIRSYNADQLPDALSEWRSIARDAASEEILRARPVTSEVDHEALSREFMARFPNIRAALAKK
jgi:hypothetical protein